MAKAAPVSPFAPKLLPEVPAIDGVRFATAEAGIRYKGRTDLLLAVLDPGTTAAGVLTQSKTRSAPVEWCAQSLLDGRARALVVNSGNANAFTGKKGREAVEITAEAAAAAVGCPPSEVFIASTGVIGEPMDAGKFAHLLGRLAGEAAPDAWGAAARAIMTTDTFPKLATRHAKIGGTEVVINGFCKGAGMIQPDMATMLCFVFTDAAIAAPALQAHRYACRRPHLQLRDHRRRHLDQRHADCICHRSCRAARRARASPMRPIRALPRSRPRCTTSCASWRSSSPRTARASPSSSPSRSRAPRATWPPGG